MSLVERAMSRMRPGEASVPAGTLSPVIATPSIDAASGATRIAIDLNSMRAAGYLPEQEKDRQFADHFRLIKRPLMQRALQAPVASVADRRLIMVTSALPGDGKTFTSINLAMSIARERDVSVLLVDADLLKPHVSKIFGLQKERGLGDLLMDESQSAESAVVGTDVRGLSILPGGAPLESIAELLGSDRMRRIVQELCAANPRRIVLLDSPPLLITSEAQTLIGIAGQVVLVVRAGQTPQRAVTDAIKLIDDSKAGGLVLNEARVGLIERYYGYGYGKYGTYGDAGAPKN
jgi:exopolysaccharide/PEP-CTERM locus tyrosine autokinase